MDSEETQLVSYYSRQDKRVGITEPCKALIKEQHTDLVEASVGEAVVGRSPRRGMVLRGATQETLWSHRRPIVVLQAHRGAGTHGQGLGGHAEEDNMLMKGLWGTWNKQPVLLTLASRWLLERG